jgi:hypothetical protein
VKNILAIFTPKPEPEAPKPEPKGGLDVLRGRAGAHARLPQGANWLKEALHISGDELNRFLAGGDLPLPKIALLIAYLGVKAEYLPDLDLLRSTAEPAFPMAILPIVTFRRRKSTPRAPDRRSRRRRRTAMGC